MRLGLGAPVDPGGPAGVHGSSPSPPARVPVATVTGRRDRPDPRYFVGSGKAEELEAVAARQRRRRHPLRPCAVAQPGAQPREAHRAARARPQRPDPRHLRAARAQLRGQARGRARAAEAHRQPPGARLDPPRAAEGRHRPARPGRDAARDRPPPDRRSACACSPSAWRRSAAARDRAPARAPRSRCPRSRWSATPTPASRRCSARSPGRMPTSPTSCSRRSIRPCGASRCPGGTRGGGRRHRRLHPRAAARAGGGLPVDAHRGARGDAAAARGRRERPAARRADRAGGCGARRDRRAARSRRSWSTTRSTGWSWRRASTATPTGASIAVWISAASGVGTRPAAEAVAERLARFARRARLRMPAERRRAALAPVCRAGGARRERSGG